MLTVRQNLQSSTFIRHKNCSEECPENCREDGWTVKGQSGIFADDEIRIECGKR